LTGCLLGGPTGTEERIDQGRQSVGLTDNDACVLPQLLLAKLALKQLSRTAYAAERVLDFVRKLPDHLAAGAVLNEQRVFPAYLSASGDVSHFDQQSRTAQSEGRNPAIDNPFLVMSRGRCQAHFVGVASVTCGNPRQDFAHFRLVVDQLQQGFTLCAAFADTEDIFGRRIHADYQQVLIKENNAAAQRVDQGLGAIMITAVVVGTWTAVRARGV